MKTWKIILLIITVLVVSFIGFVIYNGYQYSKFYDSAENLGSVKFGTEIFNSKLKDCQLSYSDTWEIRGLENENCVISFVWGNDVNYNSGIVKSDWVVCELLYELYSEAGKVKWSELVNSEYCNF